MILPENILKCLSKEDRKQLGRGGATAAETLMKAEAKNERDLHKQIRALLSLHGIEFIESRMDKRTTQKKGVPDFIFAVCCDAEIHGIRGSFETTVACAYECKFGKGELSTEQHQMAIQLQSPPNGWRWRVIRSLDEMRAELKELGLTT